MIAEIAARAEPLGLDVAGALHPETGGTLVLLMAAPGFWDQLKRSPEFSEPDPVDRYSARVVGALAGQAGAQAVFPFGGPPYAPFIAWALASGRAWQSPVGMLVHDRAGLMISYRGALRFGQLIPLAEQTADPPCATCAEMPCRGSCPVDALNAETGYDVGACHSYLDTPGGKDCMSLGCRARRACPASRAFGRDPEQSAHHMAAFHPS